MKLDDVKFDEKTGLVPVIVQDVNTREVLMLAYANMEALKLTMTKRVAYFWSRSRKRIWMKGEESGNIQYVKEILIDCDRDAVLYLVEPRGPACHTGERTCFHNRLDKNTE